MAVSPSDTAPALVALEAEMVLRRGDRERVVPAEDFFLGPGVDIMRMTVLRPGELLTAIRLPETWAGAQFYFEKVRDREVWDFPLVNVASAIRPAANRIERMRLVVGAVAARPWRLVEVEAAVAGLEINEETAELAGRLAIEAAEPLRHNGYKIPLMRNLVKRAHPGSHAVDVLTSSGRDPWGQAIFTHISWDLLWVTIIAGVAFLLALSTYLVLSAHRKRPNDETDALEAQYKDLPERIDRHSLMARLFHWVMAASMFVLLITAFFPIAGLQFPWVTWHWVAGVVLTGSILYHIIHATFWLDFWSMWIGPSDIPELKAELLRELGHEVEGPKPGKYPLGHRLYHFAIFVVGTGVITTGWLMMPRIRTPLFDRNPYYLSDVTVGLDVCPARANRNRLGGPGHRPRLLRGAARQAVDHQGDVSRLDHPSAVSPASRAEPLDHQAS